MVQAIVEEETAKSKISHLDKQLTLDRKEVQYKFQQELDKIEHKCKLEPKEAEYKYQC